MGTVTLKDIAARAGVSLMTVSKVMRDAPDISAETKTRIKLLAQQMGYVPDSVARGLRYRKTKLLGLVIPSIANPIFARMVMAIEDKAHELGYELILAQTHNIPEREDSNIIRLLSRRVEGLLICPAYRPADEVRTYRELQHRGVPTVILGPTTSYCREFVNVECDDIGGSRAATQHLLKLGHTRIAFLTGPLLAPWAQRRLEGYRAALREAGLELDDKLVFQAGSTIEDGTKAAQQMLAESCNATAVQAATDMAAIGCAELLLKHNIAIPDTLSIVGFGNIMAAEYFRVPLTTVRQPKHGLGEAAFNVLTHLLGGKKPDPVQLGTELIIRASTGPARTKTGQ
ncbi:MAG: LacI family transcriptional regulator [Verrucomicrobiae bacterium]|nr:LacI family transcriptional regulator [Verrucomicrobiae bacterium]MDW7980751.1 LacI family DNA-binding transcriptional regulator [Verrucomicrobiales bacterium]